MLVIYRRRKTYRGGIFDGMDTALVEVDCLVVVIELELDELASESL